MLFGTLFKNIIRAYNGGEAGRKRTPQVQTQYIMWKYKNMKRKFRLVFVSLLYKIGTCNQWKWQAFSIFFSWWCVVCDWCAIEHFYPLCASIRYYYFFIILFLRLFVQVSFNIVVIRIYSSAFVIHSHWPYKECGSDIVYLLILSLCLLYGSSFLVVLGYWLLLPYSFNLMRKRHRT